jgi:hypothetical protein
MGHKIDDNIFLIMRVSFSLFGKVKKERHFGRSFPSYIFPNRTNNVQRAISRLTTDTALLHDDSHLMLTQCLTEGHQWADLDILHDGHEKLDRDLIYGSFLTLMMQKKLQFMPDVIISHDFRIDRNGYNTYERMIDALFNDVYVEQCNRLHIWYPAMALKA